MNSSGGLVPVLQRRLVIAVAAVLAVAAVAVPVAARKWKGAPPPEPQIVNGLLTQDFPSVGMLLYNSVDGAFTDPPYNVPQELLCSGTLIGCQTFLTAGHCLGRKAGQNPPVLDLNANHYLVFLQNAGFFRVSAIAAHPMFTFPTADVAVAKLTPAVTSIFPSPIDTVGPPNVGGIGDAGTIPGFGMTATGNTDFGIKRFGEVDITSCIPTTTAGVNNTNNICWDFPNQNPQGAAGSDSNTCQGDSGGPLFIGDGCADPVVGVTSGGDGPTCQPEHAWDARVNTFKVFIQNQGGADLNNMMCGTNSHVEDGNTIVRKFNGNLTGLNPQANHNFAVPPGAVELRVALNGEIDAADFDLYLRRGAPATTALFNCRHIGTNQQGYCQVNNPAADTWHVLVNRIAGAGDYQVTVTIILPMKLRHFHCWETRPAPFTRVPNVSLDDQFGHLVVDVRKPERLCAPANKNGEDCRAPTDRDHLTFYRTKPKTPFTRVRNQVVVDQFSQSSPLLLDVLRPIGILVPTAKGLDTPPDSPAGAFLDHFNCYKVRRSKGSPRFTPRLDVLVEDQFGPLLVDLVKIKRFCAPVSKNGEDPDAPNHKGHLICYVTRGGARLPSLPVYLLNQFGLYRYPLVNGKETCVPALKNPPPGSASPAFLELSSGGLFDGP